jgi:RHS repeat-associated protein
MATPGGSVLERYSYSPYGVPLGGDLDPGARLATGNLFGFTGAERDPAFALVDLGARTYSPDLARFLTPDPLTAGTGMALPGNPYSYAASNPLGYVDPTGLIEERLGLDQYPTPGELLFWNVVETVGAASAAMLVILAAPVAGTAVGIASLAVGGALTASHLTAVVEDWEAYLQGDYGSVGGNDPVYAWAAEHLGSWGTVALGIAEGVFWARFGAAAPTSKESLLKDAFTGRYPDETVAAFEGWQRTEIQLTGPVQLFSVSDAELPRWWMREPPTGELQWRIDEGVSPAWRNTGRQLNVLRVPGGNSLTAFAGRAASQGGCWVTKYPWP